MKEHNLVCDNIYFQYNKKADYTLRNISFTANGSGIYGLLGPNGAGKTTLMNILVTLLKPNQGMIIYNNHKVDSKNIRSYKNNIGYMPQDINLYPNFTVKENLELFLILSQINEDYRENRLKELVSFVNLEKQINKKYKHLSGGMKRRLGLAIALCNDPKILIIDEATTGVDPIERINIRNLLLELGKNKIILFSSHIIEDIAYCCHTINILINGEIVYSGEIPALLSEMQGKVWKVETNQEIYTNNKLLITHKEMVGKSKILRIISDTKPMDSAISIVPSLEDAFIYINRGEIINDRNIEV